LIDYLDEDIAYLLGLIVARGEIIEGRVMTSILITFPFRNLEVEGLTKSYKNPVELSLTLDKIVNRIRRLDVDVRKETQEKACQLVIESRRRNLFMRVIRMFLKGKSYLEFHIPKQIFDTDESIKKEFMRGYADLAGYARLSNAYIDGRHRIYLDVLNGNWHLPVELCTLLQDHLGVPVQTIDWGHPNIRNGNLREYSAGRRRAWAREHQIKIFAEDFVPIGFYMKHKQEILRELATYNKKNHPSVPKFCSPPKRIDSKRPHHPGENDELLPDQLRGKHFDAYWQVCEAMGCPRCKKQAKLG